MRSALRPVHAVRSHRPRWLRREEIGRRVAATPWLRSVPPRHLKDLVAPRDPVPEAVALTFDDGPDPQVTTRLLRVLARHDARATFFMCGLAADRHPDLVRAVAAEGHSVGAHGWDHRPVRALASSEWNRQILRPLDVLSDLTGRRVRWFRPPRGAVARSTVAALRERGVTTLLWSAEALDWLLRAPADIADSAQRHLDHGGVVLLHDAAGDLLRQDLTPRAATPPTDAHTDRDATVEATDMLLHRVRQHVTPLGLDELPGAPILRRASFRTPYRGEL